MRVAIASDIHGNRHAFEAVIAAAEGADAEELWCLGDLVGYGAEPDECVALAEEHCAVCLAGNHDLAATGRIPIDDFSRGAALAVRWTQDVMRPESVAFLDSLSPTGSAEGVGLFHTLDMASVGYGETPILKRLNLRLDPDDRIALLGRNGNGKTTLARLLAAQLAPMEGAKAASGKLRVGYFTQYQVEELSRDDTPLEHMTRKMAGATPAAVRGQLGRFGFSGPKATTQVGRLSGGERARLALALITRDAPHMLILDEPTNHLDVDAREALIQALNAYSGAVVIVSHDRHMLEMTADRLVLVDGGTAQEYGGSLDDYIALVLAGDPDAPSKSEAKASRKEGRRAAAEARGKSQELRRQVKDAEAELARLAAQRSQVDRAMFDPASAEAGLGKLSMGDLMRRRGEIEKKMAAIEAKWMDASEALEKVAA